MHAGLYSSLQYNIVNGITHWVWGGRSTSFQMDDWFLLFCINNANTFFTTFLHILVRKVQMFPSTRRILWESIWRGNLTQPLISHVLLLLTKMHWFHLSRTYNTLTCLSRAFSYTHWGWFPLQSFIQSCRHQTTNLFFVLFNRKTNATTRNDKATFVICHLQTIYIFLTQTKTHCHCCLV